MVLGVWVAMEAGNPGPIASGVLTSLAFMRNWSVTRVLEAASLRSNSVFTSFYLKNVHYIFYDFCLLGAFVVAGQVIDPSVPL